MMDAKEYCERIGKVFGIKRGLVLRAFVQWRNENHLDQRITLVIMPNKNQAEIIKNIAYEYCNIQQQKDVKGNER